MSSSLNTTLFFLLISFMILFNEVQARESQFSFFSKTNPSKQTQQVYYQDQGVQHEDTKNKVVDFTPLSAFKDYTTTTAPSSETNGHGLYGHNADKEAPLTSTTENQASTTSTFKPYTTFTYPKPKTNTNTNVNKNTNKDLYSGFSGYGMSDTRVMENGKYHYHLTDEERQEALNVKPQNDQVDQWFSYQNDVNNNNNNNMYELRNYDTNYNPSTTTSGKTKSYGSYGSSQLRNQNGVYYQNNNNNYNEAGYYYEPSYSKEAGTHEEPDMYVP